VLPVTESGQGDGHGGSYRGGRGNAQQAEADACSTKGEGQGKGQGKGQPTGGAVEPRGPGAGTQGEGGRGGEAIRGRTTIAEAAQYAGVSVERLLQELKLPASTLPDSRLAPLQADTGLSMSDLRAAIERLRQAPSTK
jgi:hypothetical protein